MTKHLLTIRNLSRGTRRRTRYRSSLWWYRGSHRGRLLLLRWLMLLLILKLYRCRLHWGGRLGRSWLHHLLGLRTHDRIDFCYIDNSLSTLLLNWWWLSHWLLLRERLLERLPGRTRLHWLLLRRRHRLLSWRLLLLLRSILSLLRLGMQLLLLLLKLLLRLLSLLHLLRLHPNVDCKLLEPLFQGGSVVVLVKGFCRSIERFL